MYTKDIFTLSNKWDYRFLDLAQLVSTWSKDPSKQIGAVAIGDKRQILAQGYNGFPRGVIDSEDRYADRQRKYELVVHAEMNVIYNASYNGVSLDGSTLYVHGLPVCSECAKAVIQVGVRNVIMRKQVPEERWLDSWMRTKAMFKEAGVYYGFI